MLNPWSPAGQRGGCGDTRSALTPSWPRCWPGSPCRARFWPGAVPGPVTPWRWRWCWPRRCRWCGAVRARMWCWSPSVLPPSPISPPATVPSRPGRPWWSRSTLSPPTGGVGLTCGRSGLSRSRWRPASRSTPTGRPASASRACRSERVWRSSRPGRPARFCGPDGRRPPASRSGPSEPRKNGKPVPARRLPTSGPASPGSFMTSSLTLWG
jgi:hypothetical protein